MLRPRRDQRTSRVSSSRSGALSNSERGIAQQQAAGQQRDHPVQAGAQHLAGGRHGRPGPHGNWPRHARYRRHGLVPFVGACGQHAGGHGARRGAEDDPEGIWLLRQQFRHGLQHAHLVGRTRATSGQDQGRGRGNRSGGWKVRSHRSMIIVRDASNDASRGIAMFSRSIRLTPARILHGLRRAGAGDPGGFRRRAQYHSG